MKANPPARTPALRWLICAVPALLAGCQQAAVPPPRITPAPLPAPAAPPAAATADWQDAPLAPGRWAWQRTESGSQARFGAALSLTCANGAVALAVPAAGLADGAPLTLTTSSSSRLLSAHIPPAGASPTLATATLAASDPLLDALAFSRGRFMVELPGQPRLIVPAVAEVGRVIEDCRAARPALPTDSPPAH